MNIREFCENLLKNYEEMSLAFSSAQTKNNLQCPSDCGRCCQNPSIEASVLEMLPMALYLHDNNLTDAYLEKIDQAMNTTQYCIGLLNNRCHLHPFRPTICRMFGVSGHLDKNRKLQASICKVLKEVNPQDSQKVIADPENHNLPVMTHWSSKLLTLEPELLSNKMHINLALKHAIQKVELYLLYAEQGNVR